jgi:hypothetical protein
MIEWRLCGRYQLFNTMCGWLLVLRSKEHRMLQQRPRLPSRKSHFSLCSRFEFHRHRDNLLSNRYRHWNCFLIPILSIQLLHPRARQIPHKRHRNRTRCCSWRGSTRCCSSRYIHVCQKAKKSQETGGVGWRFEGELSNESDSAAGWEWGDWVLESV